MQTIFQMLLYQQEKHSDTVLATIIRDDGSAPRGTGSQMLVGETGLLAGTIGGGAVEARSIELARELLQTGDTGVARDYRFREGSELGMVCGGDVTVLFSRAPWEDTAWHDTAVEVLHRIRERIPGWLLLPLNGAAPRAADQTQESPEHLCIPLPVGERAVIFGAGHIARALVPLLHTVGFRPVVLDDRPAFTTAERFPQADTVICGDFDHIADYVTLTPEDYVVIMTNGHDHDYKVQEQVLRGETAYVGVVGSRKKIAYVNGRLREAGISPEAIAFVHTPVGTPIKAVTPEELAVSITGEMILVRAERREQGAAAAHGCPMG